MDKSVLERYGEFAAKEPEIIIAVTLIVTLFLGVSALSITIETDFNKSLPQDIEVIQNQNLLESVFSESDSLFILAELDNSVSRGGGIRDMRNPETLRDLDRLQESLRNNPDINLVFGPSDVIKGALGFIPDDIETVKSVLSGSPEFFGQSYFGKDYSVALLTVRIEGKTSEERTNRIIEEIYSEIEDVGFPGSVKLTVTGYPIIQKVVFDLLFDDLFRTLSLSGILILITLVVAYRSPIKGFIAITTLFIAVIWTGGTMVLVGIPLSIITVTVGSLIIGIGIDYAIHMMNRYREERFARKDEEHHRCRLKGVKYSECLKSCFICYGVAVDRVGRAIIGTAVTTIVSFISLAGAGVPFLTEMGVALSLGIFYSMILAIFVLPSFMVLDEKVTPKIKEGLKF